MSSNSTVNSNTALKLEPQLTGCGDRTDTSAIRRLGHAIEHKLIKGFTPAYFVTVMGTGVSSGILYRFPYPARWLEICGYIMFGIGVIFLLLAFVCFVVSMLRYPQKFKAYHNDPAIAPYMGCLPMGYNTLVNFLYYITGTGWIIGILVLWWISVVLSLYTACVVFYTAFLAKRRSGANYLDPKELHATLLLPIVTLTVAALSGNAFALDLPSVDLQVTTMIVSYILWSNAISLAVIIISVYYWKLFVYKIPPTNIVFTSFLPIGVLGQGAFCIILFGNNVYTLIVKHHDTLLSSHYLHFPKELDLSSVATLGIGISVGQAVLIITAMVCLFLISFGYFSTYIAVISCISKTLPFTKNYNIECAYNPTSLNRIKKLLTGFIAFNRTYWAMTFPLGTMVLSNNELSKSFGGLRAFRVIATIYAVALLIITIGCICGVIYKIVCFAKYTLYGTCYEKI